jgi:hypothetical protein
METVGLAADKCVFEGTARNSVTGLPVAKASIHLLPIYGQTPGYAGTTDGAGAFHFEGIEAGDYHVETERAGYVWRPNSKLHLAPGQTVDKIELRLTPEGGVAGKVLGPDGEPLRGARISLIAQRWWRGKRIYRAEDGARTDDAGTYHSTGLAPGRYFIYAARPQEGPLANSILEAPGKPEMRIAGRYYPDSGELEGAAPVEVRAGAEIAGIDCKLPLVPVFHARGKAAAPPEKMDIYLAERNNGHALEWTAESAGVHQDGSFDIAGVGAGNYFLYSLLDPYRPDRPSSAKIPVTVEAQDVSGLLAPSVIRFDLQGRIRLEDGSAPPPPIAASIFCEASNVDYNRFQGALPEAGGTFVIAALPADRYFVYIQSEKLYLKSVRVKGAEVEGAEIDLTNGPAEDVELIVSDAAGSVEGTVKEPHGETMLLAIPEGVPFAGTRPLSAEIDQDGHFRIAGLAPGHYRAFAVTGFDSGLWQNAEFQRQMANRGTAFEVAEKGSARIEVEAVAASEVRQVEERIQ